MPWRKLARFDDSSIPKLHNLRRAAAAGLRVPETWWLRAAGVDDPARVAPPASLAGRPLILRSGSPTEDTRTTSNAGQLLSLPVREPAVFGVCLARVVAALPRDGRGAPLGVVFAQPLVDAEEAGVAFFDGFYFERTVTPGGNEGLTGGRERGEVVRGHLLRDDPWSGWIARVHRVFAREAQRIDVELARDARGWVLLQSRPALFPVARNETLSLANHKEILGDPPSPWITSVLGEAGREVLAFFAEADPEVGRWEETYAVELAGRAWMNFSFFFRLMDRWGLPRAFVTQGVGGEEGGPADRRLLAGPFLRSGLRLLRLQLLNLRTIRRADRELARLDGRIAEASTLAGLHRVNVEALAFAIRTNFAINGVLSGVSRVRRLLRLRGRARVVTREMMEEYGRLAELPASDREAGLDRWLARYGHRGPLESDPARPRFAELREVLVRDAGNSAPSREPSPPVPLSHRPPPNRERGDPVQQVSVLWEGSLRNPSLEIPVSSGHAARRRSPSPGGREGDGRGGQGVRFPGGGGLAYRIDEIRESFRDDLMRRWQRLRAKILAEATRLAAAGELDAPEDVFYLRGEDLAAGRPLREAAAAGRERIARATALDLPLTASRGEIEAALARSEQTRAETAGRRVFPGIALSLAVVEGRAVRATDLVSLLERPGELGPDAILVVAALEPSWAVVFPRVGGVVAEIGGELSHASILLREAARPAVVNCAGIFRAVATGDRLRLDGVRGLVEIVG